MRFLIRDAMPDDVDALLQLARQAPLLNLPPDRRSIERKIEGSRDAFSAAVPAPGAEYLFVLYDSSAGRVVGTSLIIASFIHRPQCFFKIVSYSPRLVLRLGCVRSGYTGIGGLVVDKAHRNLPYRIGKQISLIRFVYMGMFPDRFEPMVFSELMAPLTDAGSNDFWDMIGGRITGLTYEDAFNLSKRGEFDFVKRAFPAGEIELTPEQAAAHRGLDNVLECGKPEQRILERVGFRFLNQINPMDGALQYGCALSDISIIRGGEYLKADPCASDGCSEDGFLGMTDGRGHFRGGYSPCRRDGKRLLLPESTMNILQLLPGERIYRSESPFLRRLRDAYAARPVNRDRSSCH